MLVLLSEFESCAERYQFAEWCSGRSGGRRCSDASCTLTSLDSGAALKAISEATGLLTFPEVAAGAYNLEVKATGSTEAARINVAGGPNLSKSDRTFYHNFNTAAFSLPAVGTFGHAGIGILRGPGINNWDMAASKRFTLFSESRWIQFRAELFNAWNHTQFAGLYTTAQF